jgi:DNA-binding beta-propeller fold protein YncE
MDRRRFLLAAAGIPLALAVDPLAAAARLKGSPVALVTADLESCVVVLDLETARPVRRIETAPGPRAIEFVVGRFGRGVVVVHTVHGAVTLVGADSLSVRSQLDAFQAPRYVSRGVLHGSIGTPVLAYVSDSEAQEVVTLDVLGEGRVLWRTPVPGPARHISTSPDGRTVWTTLGSKAERIAVLDATDPRRPRLVRTIAPPFLAHDVVFAPDGEHAWVTSGAGRRIALYRAGSRELVRILAADRAPQHIAFAGDRSFVASGDDGTVRIHRLNGDLVRQDDVPLGSYNVTFGARHAITPSLARGTVAVLDGSGRVRAVRRIARAAHDACIVSSP